MNPMIAVHVLFGSLALLAGAAALAFRKGSELHVKAGTVFFVSMLIMTGTGALVAAFLPERGTAVIGILTAYLVATAWTTARRRDGAATRFEAGAAAAAFGCAAAMLGFGLTGLAAPDGLVDSLPAPVHFPFAALAALAGSLDLAFLLRKRLSPRQRIGRHVWRMSTALMIAAFSFFLGQQDEFPEAWRGAWLWFVPPFATLGIMTFWLLRVRFAKGMGMHRPPIGGTAAAAAA